ncbi:unnamed protein product, partial [Dracunculus medinensis]|uniref:DUF1758 domain-containing protein n=1 Tax=Dracunculus medinensis TaxID=318479 RepID=A0A0N4U6K1_DRAME
MKPQHYRCQFPNQRRKGLKQKDPAHFVIKISVRFTQQRTKRLKELKARLNCFDNSHKTTDCKSRKRPHNTALCEEKYQGHDESNKEEAKSVNVNITNKNQTDQREKEVLLLCRKVNVINPVNQEIQSEAIVLFDTGAQTSFVSKKLAQKLKLEVGESGVMRNCLIQQQILNFVSVLYNDHIPQSEGDRIFNQLTVGNSIRPTGHTKCVERPDILIGADYFSQFIPFKQCQVIRSGFSLINT